MNERERTIATLTFQPTDRVPLGGHGPRESTLAAWREQGLPQNENWFDALCRIVGIDYEKPKQPRVNIGVDFRLIPRFEEKIIEHENGHYVLQDWMGNVVEISDKYDPTYIRSAKDFVTRRWRKFPVVTPQDFMEMKKRYCPDSPERFPADFKERCKAASKRDYFLSINIAGPFWQMREWCGFEPLCIFFAEQQEFISEMTEFWSDFVAEMLERLLSEIIVDCIHISEDMAYKGASMISPKMTRRFLAPAWKRWGKISHNAGVPVYAMDSDGKVDDLVPIWIESGLDACDPMEVAAGCDVLRYRERFGKTIAFSGGIDKRRMAKGGRELASAFERIEPVVREGGYIPWCDHGIPPDVSWNNMQEFMSLAGEVCGWL